MVAPLAVKDLRLALTEHADVPMPVGSPVRDRLVELVASGW
jgi:hypothetical protein